MELYIILLLLSIILFLLSTFQFYQIWNSFRSINIGDKISSELSYEGRKRTKLAMIFIILGVILNLIGIFIRP